MKWYLKVLRNYANFNGRARRKEYWTFLLFNLFFSITASLLDLIFGTNNRFDFGLNFPILNGYFELSYYLFALIPSLSVFIRRLHDTGQSAWIILIVLIPVLGWIQLFIFMILNSKPGVNKYGLNPKEQESLELSI